MNIPTVNELFDFYHSISETYNLQIWNTSSFAKHFKIDPSCFEEDPEKEYLIIQNTNHTSNWRTALLSGTIFFLRRRRMIRNLPIFFEIYDIEELKFLTDPLFIEKTNKIIKREIILDSIPIRIFKIGNEIVSATSRYPINLHKKTPKITLEVLNFVKENHKELIDLIHQGFIVYINYLDPMYVDSVTQNIYLSNITTSQGAFLDTESVQKISKETKIAMNKEILNPLKLPTSNDGWKNFYMNCLGNCAKDKNLGYLFKINLKITDKFSEQVILKLKNPYSLNIHNNILNIKTFYQKLYTKIMFQVPDYLAEDTLLDYFKSEITRDYSNETFIHFYETFLKKAL